MTGTGQISIVDYEIEAAILVSQSDDSGNV
jgi:hypothetical protein